MSSRHRGLPSRRLGALAGTLAVSLGSVVALSVAAPGASPFAYASDGVQPVGSGQADVVFDLRSAHAPLSLTALAHSSHLSAATRRQALSALTPPTAERDAVARFATEHGLAVEDATGWTVLVRGPAPRLARLLHTSLTRRASPLAPTAGRAFTVARSALRVPRSLAGVVDGVVGLDNRPVWHSNAVPSGYGYAGPQLASAYAASQGGAGVTVATMQYDTLDLTNVLHYAAAAGVPLPGGQVTLVGVDGAKTNSKPGYGDVEDALDVESILAVAPQADQRVYFAPNTYAGSVEMDNKIAQDAAAGKVQVVSSSWGACEQQTYDVRKENKALARIAAAGATLFSASGDNGAKDCQGSSKISVDFPSSSPYAVAVGGTRLTQSSGVWKETGWADSGGASGGGTSVKVLRPSWQAGFGPAGSYRLVPDISSDADPATGFAVYGDFGKGKSSWGGVGGTSLAAPTQAGLLADALAAAGHTPGTPGIGDIHAALYAAPATAFRDVTTGKSNGKYYPGPGYDEVTGRGSPLWSQLAPALGLTPGGGPTPTPTSTTSTPTPPATSSSPSPTSGLPSAPQLALSSPRTGVLKSSWHSTSPVGIKNYVAKFFRGSRLLFTDTTPYTSDSFRLASGHTYTVKVHAVDSDGHSGPGTTDSTYVR